MKNRFLNPNIELVHLVTVGSVDDGKSTLIGRLLYDCQSVFEDQVEAIRKTSQQKGFKDIDYSLLLDGLSAEREQGITIDVAYRYFSTPKRRFIIADVPGHEQYTRNMVTGASNADLAILLIDARKGMLIQSKRHLFLASLLGIPHILFVINKMDLVNYDKEVFRKIKVDLTDFATKLNIYDLQFIPVSALNGDLVVQRKRNMKWYNGSTLLSYLENLEITSDRNLIDFRFPVQLVLRPNMNFRGYAGKIESGIIKQGEEVIVLPSHKKSTIKSIIIDSQKRDLGFNPQTAVIVLNDELDISRGDMIVRVNNLAEVANSFEAMVCWFSEEPLRENKSYLIKHLTQSTRAYINKLRYRINIDDLHRQPAENLELNDIGRVCLKTHQPVMFDAYENNKSTGSFIIIDEITNNTVGAGLILHKIIESSKEKKDIGKGAVIWFTGLSGSGKSIIADRVCKYLRKKNIACQRLDGDIMRKALSKDLNYTKEDRNKNIERAAFVAELLSKHGVIVLASFISPYRKQRNKVRKQVGNFIEVFVNASIQICERRDTKGLYKKAKAGKIQNFTGISDPYQAPKQPEIELKTDQENIKESTNKIIKYLEQKGFV